MSKVLKITALVMGVVAMVGIGAAVYIASSPQPMVWLLRNQFGEAPDIQNVENYDAIKKNVIVHKDLVYPSANEKITMMCICQRMLKSHCRQLYGFTVVPLLPVQRMALKTMPSCWQMKVMRSWEWTMNGHRKSVIPGKCVRLRNVLQN